MGEVMVIGGGPAGASFAIAAACAGRKVVLLEQTSGATDKVCGEFLSAEALDFLRALGVDARGAGAVAITHVRLARSSRGALSRLPFPALSLRRRCMDELLLACAAAVGVEVLRGCHVRGLSRDAGGWTAALTDGGSVVAEHAVLATGKHDVRGLARPEGTQNGLVGLKTYWELTPEQHRQLDGCVELFLFRDGYAGLQLVEGGVANLTCLVRGERLKQLGGYDGVLAAMQAECGLLRERLEGAKPTLTKPLAIAGLPYGLVRRTTPRPRLWALGDQAAVIPSFTGDGMSIALYSGMLAARMFAEGATAAEFQRALGRSVSRQVALATAMARGLLCSPVRAMMMGTVRAFPPAMRWAASATRVQAPAAWTRVGSALAMDEQGVGLRDRSQQNL